LRTRSLDVMQKMGMVENDVQFRGYQSQSLPFAKYVRRQIWKLNLHSKSKMEKVVKESVINVEIISILMQATGVGE
jgi:hypothetical protein